MRGRWFFTADKYSMDADGFYRYAGRSDDMFRVSGQWVSPIEVENALIQHASVLEAAVVAYEENTTLHTPKAFVVLVPGCVPGPELVGELQQLVKQEIAPHQYPRRIEFLAELPKNAAGKVLRHKLREAQARVAASAVPSDEPFVLSDPQPRSQSARRSRITSPSYRRRRPGAMPVAKCPAFPGCSSRSRSARSGHPDSVPRYERARRRDPAVSERGWIRARRLEHRAYRQA